MLLFVHLVARCEQTLLSRQLYGVRTVTITSPCYRCRSPKVPTILKEQRSALRFDQVHSKKGDCDENEDNHKVRMDLQ
jgi:hypothetical protein